MGRGEVTAKSSQQQKVVMEGRPVWLSRTVKGKWYELRLEREPGPEFFSRNSGLWHPMRHEWKRWTLSCFGKEIEDKEEQHNQRPKNGETVATHGKVGCLI